MSPREARRSYRSRPALPMKMTELEDLWLAAIGPLGGDWTIERDGLPHLIDDPDIEELGEGALVLTHVGTDGKTNSWRLTDESRADDIYDFRVERGQIDPDE